MTLDMGMAAQLAEWRRKALSGELSIDEMREWIKQVREGRVSAATTSAKSRAKKAPIDTAALLDELDSI